jgi:uncharacterized membrane protein YsdA (DUF1294 family)
VEPFLLLAAWVGIASLVALGMMGVDKARARGGGRRIPEATLLLVALVGGSPGTLLGMLAFRHKTRKAGFLLPFALIVAAQLAAAWWLQR